MDWEHIAKEIIEDDRDKWDRVVPGKQIRITRSGPMIACLTIQLQSHHGPSH